MEPFADFPPAPAPLSQLPSADWLLDAMPWGMLVVDEQRIVRRVNPQAAHWGSTVPAALLGQPLAETLLPANLRAALVQLLETTSPGPVEVLLPALEQWITCGVTRQPGGWVVYGQDITRQKQREQQYQALAENTPDVLTRWTPDLRLRYANAAFMAKTGQPLARTLGHTLAELGLPAEVSGPYEAALQRVFATGQPQEHYHDFTASWGLAHYYVRMVPELHDGHVETVLAIARDITTLRQAEAITLRQRDALTQQVTDQYQALLYSMDEGLCVMELVFDASGEQVVDCYYREFNPAFRQQSGMSADSLHKSLREVMPDAEPFWLATYGQVARTGEPAHFEHYVPQLGRWFGVHAYRIGGPGSPQVAALFTNVTARKQAEAQQAFRLALSEALTATTRPEEVQQAVASAARHHFEADRCYYCKIEDSAAIIRHDATQAGLPSVAGTYPLADLPLLQAALASGRPFVVEDVRTTDAVDEALRQLCVNQQVISYLSVPVQRHGQAVGVLCLVQTMPRAWTAAEIELAVETAERAAAAVERIRTERALRDSEMRLQAAVSIANLGTFVWHVAEDRTEEDARARVHFGLPPNGTVSLAEALVTTFHPADGARYAAAVARAVDPAGPGTLHEEFRVRHPNGEQRWLAVSGHTVFEGTPRTAVRLTGVLADITAHKQTEARHTFLLKLSDALRSLSDPVAVQETAARILGEHFGVDRAYYARLDWERRLAIIERDFCRGDVPSIVGEHRLADFAGTEPTYRTGLLVLDDVEDPHAAPAADLAAYRALAVRAVLSVPLLQDAVRVASVTLHSTTPRHWTNEEISLVEAAAERTWAAVERTRAEAALVASESKYRTLFESIDEGFCLLELHYDAAGQVVDWRYLEANLAFERQTGLAEVAGKRASELTPGTEAYWRDLYARVVETGESVRFSNHYAGTGRWYEGYAARVGENGSRQVGVVLHDITAHQQAAELDAFRIKLADTLRQLTDPREIQRTAMRVLGEQLQVDRTLYAEIEADNAHFVIADNYVRGDFPHMTGRYALRDFGHTPDSQHRGETLVLPDITDAGETNEHLAAYLAAGVQAIIGVPLNKNGRWVASLTVHHGRPRHWTSLDAAYVNETAERTWAAVEHARAEEALRLSEQRLRALIANLPGAAAFVVDPDLRYQLAGGEALGAAGFTPADLLGRTVAEAMPPEIVAQLEARYRQALAGQSFSIEHETQGYVYVSRGIPLPGPTGQPEAVLVVSYDITERKQAEEALRVSEEKFRTLFETMDQGFGIAEVLPPDHPPAPAADFRWLEVNPQFERLTGLSQADLLGGQTARQLSPNMEQFWFEYYGQVAATGQPVRFEQYEPAISRWLDVYAFALGAPAARRIAVLFSNTTARRQAEEALRHREEHHRQQLEQQVAERTQELVEYVGLLEQSEEVAQLGSWVNNLTTGELRWSAGMYRLFGLAYGTPVSPTIYLDYVVAEDRPVAERLGHALTTQPASFAETLRIEVRGTVKVLRIKTLVLYDEQGAPTQVLGIDFDVTETQRLEAENLRLRLEQQQALFEAVQAAEEEERRRMSESLHNGIGQILYATKLQLDRLPDTPELAPRREAARLLGEAIRQTRALSHELTPAILEDFGLEATLQSICRALNTPDLHWHCHFDFEESPPIAMPLQLALYRLAQELAQNVLKHAQATEATLEVTILSGWAVLRVEDNGQGFDPAHRNEGLGLRTLRSRVALLKGSVQLTTVPGQGTHCQIRLPLALS